MRLPLFAVIVCQFCFPLVSSADCCKPRTTSSCSTCSTCAAPPVSSCGACAPVAQPTPCSTCSSCSSCSGCSGCSGCNTCGNSHCHNQWDYANFNQQFYAEFYARNPWYLEAKKKEAEEKAKRIGATQVSYKPEASTSRG